MNVSGKVKWGCMVPLGVLAALTMCAEIVLVAHEVGTKHHDQVTPTDQAAKHSLVQVNTVLREAVAAGDWEKAKELLESDTLVIYTDPRKPGIWGRTPLHFAAKTGQLEDVRRLVQAGADINAADETQETPLHMAVREKHTDVAMALLQAGADIHAANEGGYTALHFAASYGNVNIVRELLKRGANVAAKTHPEIGEETPLLCALSADEPSEDITKLLIAAGADVKTKNTNSGQSSWLYAVGCQSMPIMQMLVDAGADVMAKDDQQQTALHFAAAGDSTELVQYLLNAGLGVNDQNIAKATPLHYAAEENRTACIELLLANGANVLARDCNGRTPLHYAATHSHVEAFSLLLAAGGGEGVEDVAEMQMKLEKYVKPLMEARENHESSEAEVAE